MTFCSVRPWMNRNGCMIRSTPLGADEVEDYGDHQTSWTVPKKWRTYGKRKRRGCMRYLKKDPTWIVLSKMNSSSWIRMTTTKVKVVVDWLRRAHSSEQ